MYPGVINTPKCYSPSTDEQLVANVCEVMLKLADKRQMTSDACKGEICVH